jgi:hypothetical protein
MTFLTKCQTKDQNGDGLVKLPSFEWIGFNQIDYFDLTLS